jgi:single-strand DNA-binding protein
MASFNKVILVGNLTRDPQLSYLPSQTSVVEFGLAVNRRWRSPDGQNREEVCFIDCRTYGKQAETINQYMTKGKQILIEGRLQLDTWEGKDGVKRSKHRVYVERFAFLGPPGPGAPRAAAAPAAPASPPQTHPEEVEEPAPPAEDAPPAAEGDNIPF